MFSIQSSIQGRIGGAIIGSFLRFEKRLLHRTEFW